MEFVAKKLNLQDPEAWINISAEQIRELGGTSLLEVEAISYISNS